MGWTNCQFVLLHPKRFSGPRELSAWLASYKEVFDHARQTDSLPNLSGELMHEELLSLIPEAPEVTRRMFVATSLATGFALAVQPIQAQTQITTDTNGLVAGEVKIPTKDVEIP